MAAVCNRDCRDADDCDGTCGAPGRAPFCATNVKGYLVMLRNRLQIESAARHDRDDKEAIASLVADISMQIDALTRLENQK